MQQRPARGYDSYSVSYHRAFSTNRPPGMLKVDPLRLPPLRLARGDNSLRIRPRFSDGQNNEQDVTNMPAMSGRFKSSEDAMEYGSLSCEYNDPFPQPGPKLPPIKLQFHYLRQDSSPGNLSHSHDELSPRNERYDNDNDEISPVMTLPDLPGHVVNRFTLKCYRVLPPIGYKDQINKNQLSKAQDATKETRERHQSEEVFTGTDKINSRIKRSKSESCRQDPSKLRNRVSADDKSLTTDESIPQSKAIGKRRRSNSIHGQTRHNKSESHKYSVSTDEGQDTIDVRTGEITSENTADEDNKKTADEPKTVSQPASLERQEKPEEAKTEDGKDNNAKSNSEKQISLPKDPSQMLQELRRKKRVKLKMEDVEKLWDQEMLEWIKQTGRRNAICEEMDPIYTDLAVIVGHNLLIQHLEEICMF